MYRERLLSFYKFLWIETIYCSYILNSKTVPSYCSSPEKQQISPPSFSQITLQAYNPMPAPLFYSCPLSALSNETKGLKRRFWSWSEMPGPKSLTMTDSSVEKLSLLCLFFLRRAWQLISTSTLLPGGLNLQAFDSTLIKTC